MNDLLAARSQMAMSLAFHIIFAAIGIAMPLLMVIAEWKWLRSKDEVYLTLAKRWAKGTAILFAVGAVSGTVLSFELGLLWPAFMGYAGAIIGMPFSLEGFAFFTEAIFLGIYLYGWNRVAPGAHLFAGVMVAISGALSGIFVVIANAWMNTPTGFRVVGGKPVDINPVAAMMNPAAFAQTLHMTLAAYAATGFVVAGIHAFMLRRDPRNQFHKSAIAIALTMGGVAALLQPLSGDILAKMVAQNLPVKLAAMEGQFATEKGAPLRIGGIPDESAGVTSYAIKIPYGLSILAYDDPNATVKGLNDFPANERPPVAIVHVSFQIMVACGMAMMGIGVLAAWRYWWARRKRSEAWLGSKWFLRALILGAPLGFIAIETGWIVTEVGRQPWIIYGVMRTAEAVTPVPRLVIPFITFTLLYIFLAAITVWLLLRQVAASPAVFESARNEVQVSA
jgi:cytochrome bd ubiquinol oxidase subunit I